MHLKSAIVVKQDIEQVINFFYEPSSLAKWDRSVAAMIPTTAGSENAAATFDTVAPSGMRMNYEVIEMKNGKSVKILLKNSKMFKKAIWHFQFDETPEGTQITCHIYFTLRPLCFFLYPVLFFNKSALMRDLKYFEDALNKNYNND